jgi:hypothetical protein
MNTSGEGAVFSIFEPGHRHVKDPVTKNVILGKVGGHALPGLDLLPTSFKLVYLESEYTGDPRRPPGLFSKSRSRKSRRTTTSSFSTARQTFCALPSAAFSPLPRSTCRRIPTPFP